MQAYSISYFISAPASIMPTSDLHQKGKIDGTRARPQDVKTGDGWRAKCIARLLQSHVTALKERGQNGERLKELV